RSRLTPASNRPKRFLRAVAQISQPRRTHRGKIIRQFEIASVSWQWNGIFLPMLMGLRKIPGALFFRRADAERVKNPIARTDRGMLRQLALGGCGHGRGGGRIVS